MLHPTRAASDEPSTAVHFNAGATPAAFLPQSCHRQSCYEVPAAEAQTQKEAAVKDQLSTSALPAHTNKKPVAMPDYASFLQYHADDAVFTHHHQDDAVFTHHCADNADFIQHLPYDANSLNTRHVPPNRRYEQATYKEDSHIYSYHQMLYHNYTSRYEEDWRPSTYYQERPSYQFPDQDFPQRWHRENEVYQMSRVSSGMPIFVDEPKCSSTSMPRFTQNRYITEEQLHQHYRDTLETDLQELEEKVLAILRAWRDEDLRRQENKKTSCEKQQHTILCLTCYEDVQTSATTGLNTKGLSLLAKYQPQAKRTLTSNRWPFMTANICNSGNRQTPEPR